MPLISICGAPRSGHTVTYQVVIEGLRVFYINNFQYALYRSPFLAYLLGRVFCRPYNSDYKSFYGYIPGLNGPHQGYLLWKHWLDMDRNERLLQPDERRVARFSKALNRIYEIDRRPFCSAWLGHVFYLDVLKRIFDKHVVVWTKRDLMSTAFSLLKFMEQERDSGKFGLVSQRPFECQDKQALSQMTSYEKAALQVYFMNKRMEEYLASGQYCILESDYTDLCNDPRGFVTRLAEFAKNCGVDLKLRSLSSIPSTLTHSKVSRDQNDQSRQLVRAFEVLVSKHGFLSVPLGPV